MTNKTDFESWESDPNQKIVHAMIIDRGDLTAAKRLTLTDRPLIDKTYAATYPAPIDAIASEIIISEHFRNGTRFNDIELSNANGQFDDILGTDNILKRPFTMFRGSPDWSLATTDYPNRFIEIFVGEVYQVRFDRGKVILKIRPRTYRLETQVGGHNSLIESGANEPPLCIGKCFNVSAVLVDAADDDYRVNSVVCDRVSFNPSTVGRFEVRDQGVSLIPPYTATTDYDFTDESDGEFRGMFTLTTAPTGKVTVDVNYHTITAGAEARLDANIRWLLANYATEDYPQLVSATTLATTYDYQENFGFGDSDAKMYIQEKAGYLTAFDLSPAGDSSTATITASPIEEIIVGGTLLRRGGPSFSRDGTVCYMIGQYNYIQQRNLSTAWDLDSDDGTADSSLSITFWFPTEFASVTFLKDFLVTEDDSGNHNLYLLHQDGILYKTATFTTALVDAKESITKIHDFRNYGGNTSEQLGHVNSMDLNADETKFYLLSGTANTVFQFDVLTPHDLTDLRRTKRGFMLPHEGMIVGLRYHQFMRMGANGDQMYFLQWDAADFDAPVIYEYDGFENGDLPILLFDHNQETGLCGIDAGVSYRGATKLGTVIKDLLVNWDSSFTISKDGILTAIQQKDPELTLEAWNTLYPITISDFVGEVGNHISHKKNYRANAKFTVHYRKNYTIQTDADLAGSVSQADRDDYATPYLITSATSTPAGYIDADEIILDTNLGDETTANTIRDNIQDLREVERNDYLLRLNLRCTSFLSEFGLGSIGSVQGDIKHQDFADGDQFQVVGRRLNYSANQQDLEVFK